MSDSLQSELRNLHRLFNETVPSDPKIVRDFVWTVVKQLNSNTKDIDSITCRQLLADCMRLPIERPSNLYSALLSAAIKVSVLYPDFRFAAFFKMWGMRNLRVEDTQRQQSKDGKSFPSLSERTVKALANSLLLHPEDELTAEFIPMLQASGFQTRSSSSLIHPMLVTRIKDAIGKDGRKYIFVTLTSPEGVEVEVISHNLLPSPLHPLPQGKRHFVNIGQLYDCILRTKPASDNCAVEYTLANACLSSEKASELFPLEIGYIESIDQQHAHMHIYDSHSRHFVAPVLRFSRERVGDFVRFLPIVPADSKFKTAIILTTVPSSAPEVNAILRPIRITSINRDKAYASWDLLDKSTPITELLSPLQLSLGETSPSFTSGFFSLTLDNLPKVPMVSGGSAVGIIPGQTLRALIYLKRGKDRLKRPHIALFFL